MKRLQVPSFTPGSVISQRKNKAHLSRSMSVASCSCAPCQQQQNRVNSTYRSGGGHTGGEGAAGLHPWLQSKSCCSSLSCRIPSVPLLSEASDIYVGSSLSPKCGLKTSSQSGVESKKKARANQISMSALWDGGLTSRGHFKGNLHSSCVSATRDPVARVCQQARAQANEELK